MKTYKLSPQILSFLDKKFCLDYPSEITDTELKLLLIDVYNSGQKTALFRVKKMMDDRILEKLEKLEE